MRFARPAAPAVMLSLGNAASVRRSFGVQCQVAHARRAPPERVGGAGAAVQAPGRPRGRAR